MKEATDKPQTGIQWNQQKQFDNLDFSDDIVLLSSNNQQMQDKVTKMMKNSDKLGLNPSVNKTKIKDHLLKKYGIRESSPAKQS